MGVRGILAPQGPLRVHGHRLARPLPVSYTHLRLRTGCGPVILVGGLAERRVRGLVARLHRLLFPVRVGELGIALDVYKRQGDAL